MPLIGGVVNGITNGVSRRGGLRGVKRSAGSAAGAVGNGILERGRELDDRRGDAGHGLRRRGDAQTTTPQLQSAWFEAQFAPMADLGAALGLLVALIALASAAIRRSPEALAGALAGIARAGIGTGLVVALTVIGLGIADQISSAVLASSPHTFWATVAHAWGTSGFGGFGSSALATLIALVEVFAAMFVWLELIVRDAAIYIAVLFFPVALAASIWPALGSWPGRLGRLLLLFVILKPVALIVLSLRRQRGGGGPVVRRRGIGLGRDDPRRDRDLRAGRVRAVGADVPARRRRRERLHGRRSAHRRREPRSPMSTAARCAAQAACATSAATGGAGADRAAARPVAPGALAASSDPGGGAARWRRRAPGGRRQPPRTARARAADCRTGRCRSARRRSARGASARPPVSAP